MGTAQLSVGPISSSARSERKALLTRADLPWLAVALFAALGLRIAWVAYVDVDPAGRGGDPVHYHNMARLLAEGAGYVNFVSKVPTAHWPPAYPAALAVLYKLFGWHLVLAKSLNIVFGVATVGLAYMIGRRMFDQRSALVGALILAFFPGQIYFSTLVMTETMFAMLFMLVLWLALEWTVQRSQARWWHVLLIGFLVGLAGLVRAEGVFLIFVLAALWALTVRPWRRVALYALLLAIGTAYALTPWTVRNAIQLNEFVPIRARTTAVITKAFDSEAIEPFSQGQGRSAVGDLQYQSTHPWEMPKLMGRRIARFYEGDADGVWWIQRRNPEGDIPLSEEEAGRWRALANRYFFAGGGAALVAMGLCLARRNRACLVLIIALLSWTLLFGFIPSNQRYHFALGPVISILAGAFVVAVWDGVRAARLSLLAQRKGAPAAVDDPGDLGGGG